MDLTPEQLELADFTALADGGFAPDEVRALLRQVAAQLRSANSDGVRGVAESVGAVLDQAVKSGEDIVAAAGADADAIRAGAESDAERINADAAESAAATIAEGERAVAEMIGQSRSEIEAMKSAAEAEARANSASVIARAQQRLDRLLAAEREVHDRVTAALDDIHQSLARAGFEQSRELALTVEDPGLEDPLAGTSWADDQSAPDLMQESA